MTTKTHPSIPLHLVRDDSPMVYDHSLAGGQTTYIAMQHAQKAGHELPDTLVDAIKLVESYKISLDTLREMAKDAIKRNDHELLLRVLIMIIAFEFWPAHGHETMDVWNPDYFGDPKPPTYRWELLEELEHKTRHFLRQIMRMNEELIQEKYPELLTIAREILESLLELVPPK